MTSYNYFLKLGIPASQIIFSGDSAGGDLASTLLQYIEDRILWKRLIYAFHLSVMPLNIRPYLSHRGTLWALYNGHIITSENQMKILGNEIV